ncbi:hypothetical protein [Streptomyces bobili]|uniref:hypothetical protein n=1 Tax=Streptomyces bobili TaxID=67280 RepID=UPI00380E57AF
MRTSSNATNADSLSWGVSRVTTGDIAAAADLLPEDSLARLSELAAFVEHAHVEVALIAALWQRLCGMSRQVCDDLIEQCADLLLLSPRDSTVRLDADVRKILQEDLKPVALRQLHLAVVEVARTFLVAPRRTEWWCLPRHARYLWAHLPHHLQEAGQHPELESLLSDLQWTAGKIRVLGSATAEADLSLLAEDWADSLTVELSRAAHTLDRVAGEEGGIRACDVTEADTLSSVLVEELSQSPQLSPRIAAFIGREGYTAPRSAPRPPKSVAPRRTFLVPGMTYDLIVQANSAGRLAALTSMGSTHLWDSDTGKMLLGMTTEAVAPAVLSPDWSWAAVPDLFGQVLVVDVASGVILRTLIAPEGSISKLVVAPDGSWLAVTTATKCLRIWDVHSGEVRADIPAVGISATACGNWLVTGRPGPVTVRDPRDGRVLHCLGEIEAYTKLGWPTAADGSWIAVAERGGPLCIWDTQTGEVRYHLTRASGAEPLYVLGAEEDSWLALSSREERSVRIFDTITGGQRAILDQHSAPLCSITTAPDGSWLATAALDDTVRVWDTTTWRTMRVLPGWGKDLVPAADGAWLAVGGRHTTHVWGITDGGLRARIPERRPCTSGPGGGWLALHGGFDFISVYDIPQVPTGIVSAVRPPKS